MPRLIPFLAFVLAAIPAHAQWEIQPSPTTASLRGIHALGNGIAWASGSGGTVLRTIDDGTTWQLCATPPNAEKLDFRGVQAFDASTAIVMSSGKGDLSRLYKTTDACRTWTLLFTNPDKDGFWDAIKFMDQKVGYLLGDPVGHTFPLWSTQDNGRTWRHDPYEGNYGDADHTTQGAFAASNSALWVADAQFNCPWLAFGAGGTAGASFRELCRFQNATGGGGGAGRYEVPIGHGTESSGIFSLMIDLRRDGFPVGVAVGGDYLKPEESAGTSAFSTKGLNNWTLSQTPPHGYRSAVAYSPTAKTWITVGPNGTDISTDDGRNWRALHPTPTEPPDADKNWNALSLPFVVGPHGRIGKLRPTALANPGQ
jgi:hypothetical protein